MLICVFTYSLITKNIQLNKSIVSLKAENYINMENEEEFFRNNLELYSENCQIEIPQHKFKLENNNSYGLIYLYGGDECGSCISSDLEVVREVFEENLDNFFVLPVIDSSRVVEVKLSAELNEFNFKRMNRNDIKLPSIGGKSKRFFAIMDYEGKLSELYFPNKSLIYKTKLYLNFVKRKYQI